MGPKAYQNRFDTFALRVLFGNGRFALASMGKDIRSRSLTQHACVAERPPSIFDCTGMTKAPRPLLIAALPVLHNGRS